MNCKELLDFLESYIGDDLPQDVRGRFDRHLEDCPPCEHYLDSYRKTIEVGRRALCSDDAPPERMPEELVRAILDSLRRP